MRSVGIRELKHNTSAILRRAREKGEDVAVTYRGEIVAYLVPATRRARSRTADAAWSELDRLAVELGKRWPTRASAAAAVREGRRG